MNRLDDEPSWAQVHKMDDKIHLYLPSGVKTFSGAFVYFVFHSQDPKQESAEKQ